MAKGLKKKTFSYLVLNLSLSYFFVALMMYLGLSIDRDLAFVSPDSTTYFQVGKWLYGGTPTEYLSIRPFLFPFILFSSVTFLGIKGYFLFQFIFWLGSANLLFATLNKLFNNIVISIIGVFLLVSNLSFLMLTFHALTEVFVIFLVTLLILILTLWINSSRKDTLMLLFLFVLILLSVTKPLFFYFVILFSLIVIPVLLYKYKYYKRISKMIKLLLIFVPLFFQIGIMKVNFNKFDISTAGFKTFKFYLFRRAYSMENNKSQQVALEEVRNLPDSAVMPWVLKHKNSFIQAYFQNLKENIKSYPLPYMGFKKEKNTGRYIYDSRGGYYMQILNSIYYYLHIIFFLGILYTVIKIFYRKEFNNWNVSFIVLCLLFYGFLFSSAISFNEGDRLVLPSLPIWIVLYSMLIVPYKPEFD